MSFFRKLFFKKVAGIRDTYVLEEGDVALDESDGKLYRGDGSTVGGILIQSTAGISLTDISSATTAPSGGGALVYNNTNGQITYTPPDLSGLGGGGLSNVVEDTTPQLGGDLDGQAFNITTTGKILYSNLYATEGDLPNATTYHGMFAHVHATGAGYFAHGGAWIKLANDSQLSSYQTTAGLNSAIDTHLNQSGPTSGYVLSWNGSDYAWVANSGGGGGGISNLVEDTTPQLGGNLDVNGNSFTSSGDLTLDVSGDIVLDAGGEQIIFKDGSTNVGHIDLTNDDLIIKSLVSDADIVFKGNDNGTERTPFYLDMSVGGTAMFNAGIKNTNFFWNTTDNIVAFQAGASGEISLTHVHNTGLKLTNSGTGTPAVELQFVDSDEAVGSDGTNLLLKSGGTTFKIPTADGTSGQVLQTDGNGVLSFTTVSGGGGGLSNIVEDTTPQLGGDLDTNGNKITFADSVNAEFGNSGDLKIFHNGGHSIVRETGTGSLYLQSDNNVILSTDSSTKVMVKGIANGATELYHNDILKLNTSTSGVTVVDEVHTEGATPHLTLKRTDNANVPSLRFKGSGGTVGASIEFDGTAGTSNELAFKTFDGASLAERFRVTYTGATITGTLNGHTIPGGTGTLALTSDITSASTAADDLTAGDAAVSIETTTGNITIDAQGTDTDIIFKGTDSGLDTTFLTMKGSTSTIEVHPDANFKLVSGADPNKGVKFATSGSANTTVTFGSASGTVIIHNANQTLTNKTINVDNNTVSNIEVDNFKSGVLDTDLSSVSGSDDTLASAKAIKAYVDANAGISNVVEDTSPQLGGNLDVNGNGLISIGEIDITAGGVVDINANAGNVDISAVGGNVTLSGDTSDMTFTNTGTGIFSFTGDIKAKASTGADLTLQTSATTLSASDVVGKIDFQAPDDSAGSSALLVSGGITLEANGASTGSKQYNKMVFRNSNSSSINQTAMTLEQNGSLTILGDLHSTGASGNQFDIKNTVSNGSMHFQGVDDGVDISALSFNFAESGRATFNGTAYFNNGVVESFATLTGATGTVVHDCNNGHIFLHTTPAANWTANFTNLDLLQEYRTTLEIMIVQGNTAYMPTAVQIGGVAQTVIYKGNNAPTGTDNGHNRVFFHIFNDGGTYRVYGDHDTYGGV